MKINAVLAVAAGTTLAGALFLFTAGQARGLDTVPAAERIGITTAVSAKGTPEIAATSQPATTRATTSPLTSLLNDPFAAMQWALDAIALPNTMPAGNGEVIVAVLDTGIDSGHEDLARRVMAEINLTDSPTASDLNGHGTHIAGIISATRNNAVGVSGIAPSSRLLNVKVADDYGTCDASAVARGIIWAVDNGAAVINVSLQLRYASVELEQAVDYAWSRGAIVIAAAGNEGNTKPVYPAFYANSVAVSATGPNGELAPLSNYGDWVDVAAPGSMIFSTLPGNRYGYETGTSFASAQVSGLAALLYALVIDLNSDGRLNDEVRDALEGGCLYTAGLDIGHGRINAAQALPTPAI